MNKNTNSFYLQKVSFEKRKTGKQHHYNNISLSIKVFILNLNSYVGVISEKLYKKGTFQKVCIFQTVTKLERGFYAFTYYCSFSNFHAIWQRMLIDNLGYYF